MQFICYYENIIFRCKVNKSAKMPRLESSSVDVLLENVTITSLMHLGFVSASDIAVETLTDLIAMFLRKITLSLKHASEQTNNGFPVSTIDSVKILHTLFINCSYIFFRMRLSKSWSDLEQLEA